MRLYLIRHGLTLPAGPDTHEWPLSPKGEKQAENLADAPFWNEVSALYSSPEDERLREVSRPSVWYEDYEEIVRKYLGGSAPEGWEESPDVERRVGECFSALRFRHPDENVAVCGHGLMFALHLSTLEGCRDALDLWDSIGFCRVAILEDEVLLSPFCDPKNVL